MFGFLLVLMLIVGLFMTVVILLQSGKGGGLAAMGGGGGGTAADNLIGGRQAATLLTKSTWVSGGLFLALALALSVLSSRRSQPESILQGQFQPAAPTAPMPILPGTGESPGETPAGGTQTAPPSGEAPATSGETPPPEDGQLP